jgi:hypothetical protein
MINLVKTILKFNSKKDALKFHLLAIATEEGLKLSFADIDVAIEIYISGYTRDLFNCCVENGYFRSVQSVRNSVAKLTKCGVLDKPKLSDRKVNARFLPESKDSDFIFNYQVNYDLQNS